MRSMRFIAPARTAQILILLFLLLLAGCGSLASRGPSIGHDYNDPDFQCHNGPLEHEHKTSYLLLYQTALKQFEQQNDQDRGARIMITGDSLAALFLPHLMHREFPGIRVINRGIGGDTTELFRLRVGHSIEELHPQFLVISIGGNDLLGGRCVPQIRSNVEGLLDALHRIDPALKIILTGIPPVVSWKANASSPYLNSLLRESVRSRSWVRYIDLWPDLADPDHPVIAPQYRLQLPDGRTDPIHFNEQAYRIWGARIREEMN